MNLHHIGYLTGSISEIAKAFVSIGYKQHVVFDDTIQKCFICFLERESCEPLIELVQPYEDNNSMRKMLNKRGPSPYHLCYEVDDIEDTFRHFSNEEGWLPLFSPVEAIAFDNRRISYFMNAETGLIEFVEKQHNNF